MTYGELRVGAFFRLVNAPTLLLQKCEWCAVTKDHKIVRLLDDNEVTEEERS
jgi:hypothetical protein